MSILQEILDRTQRIKEARAAHEAVRIARLETAFAELDASKAALARTRCDTCGGTRWVSVPVEGHEYSTRLVPCPVCKRMPPPPSEPAYTATPLQDWYAQRGGAQQTLPEIEEEDFE